LKQPGRIFLINPDEKNTIHQPFVLTGPLENESATLSVKNKFEQSFEPEGNYLFDIEKGLIKQKQLPYGRYPFHTFLFPEKPVYNFKDMVLTAKEIDSLWQDYLDNRSANEELLRNVMLNKVGNGSLRIAMENDKSRTRPFVKNVLLFRYDDPDFARVYKGNSRDLGYIQPGAYRLFLLFKGDDYFIKDSIVIKKDGINYFNLGDFIPLKRDSVSSGISRIIESREIKWTRSYTEYDLGRIKETFNEKYLDPAVFSRFIYGKVTDREGAPLLGASIKIKGTRIGVYADASGQFRLKVPKKGVIVISSVGYESIEIRISETSSYSVKLSPAVSELNDVVVTGYGIARKKNLTASFSVSQDNMLSGKVAGVVMRGLTSVASASPLILIDGIPFAGNIQTLDSSKFASVQYLKGPEAIALYGQSAANGLIVIATRKTDINNQVLPAPTDQTPGNNLRHNFRDAAYWQPKLRTDVNGKVTFSVTYPDDITNWRTFVIAINDRKETGFIEKNVRAFKSLSASLSIPQFAVEGDTINIIGKVLNYSFDHTQVNREFIMNDTLIKRDILQIENSCLDTFSISPTHPDSLKLKYTIQKPDGYFDGEEKNIPVVKQGIMETHGYFTALNKDTSFSIEMDSAKGKIKFMPNHLCCL
jgi:hypothetical protein